MDHIQTLRAQITDLKFRLQKSEDRIFALEEVLGFGSEGELALLGLTPCEAVATGILRKRSIASRDQIMMALYGHRPDMGENVGRHIADVWMHNVRVKLKGLGIRVRCIPRTGWTIGTDGQRLLEAALVEARKHHH